MLSIIRQKIRKMFALYNKKPLISSDIVIGMCFYK